MRTKDNAVKTIRALIFDLDGTLLDTLEDLGDAVNHALLQFGFPARTYDEIQSFVGNGVAMLMHRSVPTGTDEATETAALAKFRAYYLAHSTDKTKPFEGVTALLQKLKREGYLTAVVTNKAQEAAIPLCRGFFGDLLDEIVGDLPPRKRKPAPDSVLYAMEQLGVTKEECLFIGDSETDYQTAKNAELPCICVTWGFRTREQLVAVGAETFADHTQDILAILAQYRKN